MNIVNFPLISIIVPVYNVEKYLRKCLDSIVNQTLHEIEIICVNDGTQDNSVAILNDFAGKDERIRIVHQENSGLSAARNEGLKYARSEYIGFVDSDDWIEPDTYELAYGAMKRNNVDMVYWYAQIELEENNSFDKNDIQSAQEYHAIKNTGLHAASDTIFYNCTVTAWNKLYKKSIIEKYNISFPVGLLHEDLEFFYKYALVCKNVYFIDKYLIHYLQRIDSLMWSQINDRKKLKIDRLQIMKHLYLFYSENDLLSKYRKTISDVFVWLCFAGECINNATKNQLIVYKHAAEIVKDMDLTRLNDSRNFLNNLKQERYGPIFIFFLRKNMLRKFRGNSIYRIARKIYHKLIALNTLPVVRS